MVASVRRRCPHCEHGVLAGVNARRLALSLLNDMLGREGQHDAGEDVSAPTHVYIVIGKFHCAIGVATVRRLSARYLLVGGTGA